MKRMITYSEYLKKTKSTNLVDMNMYKIKQSLRKEGFDVTEKSNGDIVIILKLSSPNFRDNSNMI